MDRLLQPTLLEQTNGPWKMLVGCMMLNQTGRKQVDNVWPRFFARWNSPHGALMGYLEWPDMEEMLRPLGFGQKRTGNILRMSVDWLLLMARKRYDVREVHATDIMALTGCGDYAADSWRVFVEHESDPAKLTSGDKELLKFLDGHYGGPSSLQSSPPVTGHAIQ